MKYCRFETENGPRFGQVEQHDGEWSVTRFIIPWLPGSHDDGEISPLKLSGLTLLPPVAPTKILCVGRNYRDHAAELGNEVPTEPLLFLKPPSSLLAPNGIVRMPKISTRVDYEGELGIVISRRCRNIGPDEDVRPYIRGYVNVNDVTARDLQKSDGQWTRGKGFDTFCPVGPIVSDELEPVEGEPVSVTTRLNGVVRQHGSTRDMIFPIAQLLRYITSFTTLEAGDLIPTGTPAGVGSVQPGDSIQVEVDGLGILENQFAAE